MAFQNIFILGSTGKVGMELINQVQKYDMSNQWHLNPTRIVGIANSKSFILQPNWIKWERSFGLNPNLGTEINEEIIGYSKHDEILEAVKKSGLEGEIIFVDVTAEGPKMLDFHQKVIRETVNKLVTANKKPLVGSMESFQAIASNPARYLYNTSVMAWAAAVPYLQEVHGLSETVLSIQWTFSGTLAYLCSELEKWEKKFSTIVQEAKDAGYTEPHAFDDLSGEDVKRKLMILLRSAGISVEENQILLEWIVSHEKYGSLGADEFLDAIAEEDDYFTKKIRTEWEKWNVPRYVASYELVKNTPKMKVGLEFVPRDSELGILKGTANKILIRTSQRTPDECNPHTIQSPGAGIVKTAASVRSDLLHLLNNTNLYIHN
jgi:homoserine dehydrogenase